MNEAVRQILANYEIRSVEDSLRALREIMQEIALLGLWRSKFFENAAFYGGTALRVLYGLDRFSEDLDFSRNPLQDAPWLATGMNACLAEGVDKGDREVPLIRIGPCSTV